ncbi:MAG: hypothetical protein JXR68_09285 [Bacteroidales bacterium]|nr:hypothetical protein [Bacteroidales bacterium]
MKYFYIFTLLFLGIINSTIAQDSTKSAFYVNADIVSNFVWRGAVASPTLNFQPMVTYSVGNFSVGTWGTTDIFGITKEIDIFLSYSIKGFCLNFTDYDWNTSTKYFDYNNATTGHDFELGLSYENEKFPLNIYGGTIFYGDDKKYMYNNTETDSLLNNYSTYLQLSYTFYIQKNNLDVFIGATPFTGMYGTDFAIIYTGLTAKREIKITNNFWLPIFATFAANPQSQDYFAIFGISL